VSTIVSTTTPAARFAVLRGRVPLSWRAVAALAVVLAFANAFVVVTLQGAVGAIERTQNPFGDWLRYSAILVPAFGLAAMWALGGAHRRGRRTLTAVLLVAAATTAVGIAAMIVSSAYDYHLQADLLARTATLHVHAVSGNAANSAYADGGWSPEQRQTLLVAVKADSIGIALLLAVNLFFTGWITALFGGRLTVSRRSRRAC
jgi:hypothetical protein